MKFKLEKRGCDFFAGDNVKSDIGNYRVCAADIKGADGKTYFLEFCRGDKYHFRTINKRTGEPLKKGVRELVMKDILCVRTEFEDERGAWGNTRIEAELWKMNFPYTFAGIEKAMEVITGEPCKFDGFTEGE